MSIPRNTSIVVYQKFQETLAVHFCLRIYFVKVIRHEKAQGSQVLTKTTKIWRAIRSNRNSQQGKGKKQVWKMQPA